MSVLKSIGYNVVIGQKSLEDLNRHLHNRSYSRHFILCDENTFTHCLPPLLNECDALHESELLEIESGEQSKNLNVCADLWTSLTESGADRKSVLINLGGGVIGDLGGFIASTYKRGIDFINVPTTLLAMADASVGGKNGIDFAGIKNLVGTVTQPAGVFIYPAFLETLDQREVLAGLAEVIKCGLIADADLFKTVCRLKTLQPKKAEEIIHASLHVKNKIVMKDPLEAGPRKALNFGHTIGHALEAYSMGSDSSLLHGEAVALGMKAEAYLSLKLKLISEKDYKTIIAGIDRFFAGIKTDSTNTSALVDLMHHDKKNESDAINFTLLTGIGKHKINCAVNTDLIVEALSQL